MMVKKSILIVDDTPLNIKIINNILKDKYFLSAATSGKRAIEIINSGKRPDLILLDIVMPDLNGYQVCRILKTDSKIKDIPVIFISGENYENCEEKCKEAGGAAVLQKTY